jgi:aspartyl aminopeptidase
MAEKKSKGQKLADDLLSKPQSLGEKDPKFLEEASKFCEGYKKFLACKTEREAVAYAIPILKKHKYTEYVHGKKYKAGDKFYLNNRDKDLIMCTMGKKPVSEGIRVSVAHLDSPRLDFKPHPLFEDGEMVYFKTHYYGGIKKYQWTTVPMSIRGVVMLKDGTKVTINVG